jgi:hypothetical protein
VTSPAPRDDWRDVLTRDPNALFFHTPEWVDSVCAKGGYADASRLYETRDGRKYVLPLVRKTYVGGLTRRGSLPAGWGSGGVLSDGPLRAEEVMAIVEDLRQDRHVLRTFIQPGPRTRSAWDLGGVPGVKPIHRLAHVLDLTAGFDTVWSKQFTGSARTAVRKAEKSGVVVEHDATGALIPLYSELRRKSVERWARQQHEPQPLARWRADRREPVGRLQMMADAAPNSFHLYLAHHDGRPVAGILVLHGNGANYLVGAMDKDLAGPVRANYLLHRVAIENACAEGCKFYDFGETGSASQLAQFKTRFGAEPTPYCDYIIERFPLTEADRILRTAVKRAIGFRGPPPLDASTSRQRV